MLLRIFKTNQAYNLILFPIIAIALWGGSLISPNNYSFLTDEKQLSIFKSFYSGFLGNSFVQVLLALGLLIIAAFLIQKINSSYAFIRIRTLLPSTIFILFASSFSNLQTLHPVYFGLIFLLFSIDKMFGIYEKKVFFNLSFESGLFIGLGSLFYFNLISLFPAIILGFITINQSFSWRNLVLLFLGLLLPWIFCFSYFFYFDTLESLYQFFKYTFSLKNDFTFGILSTQLFIGFLALLILISSLWLLRQYDTKKISSRKYFVALFYIFIFLIVSFSLAPFSSQEVFILLAVPSSYLISNFLVFLKSKLWGEIIFSLFVAFVIYMQFL